MAQEILLSPFIKKTEGGLSRDTTDSASAHPCPYPYFGESGYHTNRGWTWSTWSQYFGVTPDSATQWYTMTDASWDALFTKAFWNKILGDQINSQRIANMIGDWFFNSGNYAEIDAQKILDSVFSNHLVVDGCFGTQTISAINSANEPEFYADITQKRRDFYQDIVTNNASQAKYLVGWNNRVNDLVAYSVALPA